MKLYASLLPLLNHNVLAFSRLKDLTHQALSQANFKNPKLNALDLSDEEHNFELSTKMDSGHLFKKSGSPIGDENYDYNNIEDTFSDSADDVSIFSGRSMNKMLANALDNLDGYGCWCYFDDQFTAGKSKPVDKLDGFCKDLLEGYQCAIMDSIAEIDAGTLTASQQCVPWMTTYHAANLGSDNIVRECELRNRRNACGRHTCIIESTFMSNVFRYLLEGGRIFTKNRHDRGFDVDASCPVQNGPNSEKLCCGEYPNRKPFKTLGGSRGCCKDRTYNMVFMQCCDDGTVSVTC